MLLFSDGDDQSSHASLEAAVARAEASDATIYVIGQGRAIRAPELQTILRRFATISGGQHFFTEDVVEARSVLRADPRRISATSICSRMPSGLPIAMAVCTRYAYRWAAANITFVRARDTGCRKTEHASPDSNMNRLTCGARSDLYRGARRRRDLARAGHSGASASASNQAGRRPRASRRQHRCRRRRARHGTDRKRLHAGSRRPYAAHRLGAVHQRRARNTDRCCDSANLQHERCRRWALDHARRRPREHRAGSWPSGHGGRQPLSVAPDTGRSRRAHRISRTWAQHRLHLQPRSDSEGIARTIWTHGYVADDLPHRRVRGDGYRPGRPHGLEHRHAARMRLARQAPKNATSA